GRVVEDLRRLLGSSELVSRIDEWKVSYQESLTRCEFGSSLEGEAETLIAEGLRARNRWSTYHHLRLLDAKVASFSWPAKLGERMRTQLAEIAELRPEDPNLDVETVATALRDGARQFFTDLNAAHRDPLFAALDEAVTAQREERFFDAFVRVRALRQRLVGLLERPAFDEQRYFFFQLEGLLEEMGYLMVRHLISQNQERGVDRSQCLEIIRLTAMNLDFDGLHSRELRDFATMLSDVGRSDAQLLDVLRSVERVYHRVRQRVTQPYERMGARLGIPAADLQQILANIHRYMHDLNSMIHVADLVATSVRQQIAQRPSDAPAVPGPADSGTTSLLDPVIHLSHRSTIAQALEDDSEGRSLREIYGGKGSGLLYISYLNIPTRDGFILPTSYGRSKLYERDVDRLQRELDAHVASLEQDIARRDGHAKRFASADGSPLLLAVRGGSVLSMPGILSTVVFVGMNDAIAERLAEDGPWRAYDSYRRFLASYASSVWGVDIEHHDLVERAKERYGVRYKHELPWEAMREISEATKRVLRDEGLGDELDAVLAEPRRQLAGATRAVFRSWDTPTARRFRDIKGIAHSWHTAAIVQEMAFGNGRNEMIEAGMDETLASLTGVITRTFPMEHGVRALDGEVKFSAAGDDLVSGITFSSSFRPVRDLEQLMPMLETRLKHVVAKLRRLMGTDQEVEFTVERGVLSVLQTRRAETQIDQATDRFLDPGEPATRGLGVRGGGFRGLAIFDEADLNELSRTNLGERDDVDGLLLVIENPTPEDIPLIISAGGLLTARGGSTSHAAVAINGIEKRAYSGVVSAVNLDVDPLRHEAVIRDASGAIRQRIKRGDIVSIHGTTGEVFVGSRRLQRVE
ncbi:MAG: hypothetical protein KC609_07335, partial [Myxococcales bacterium]|nr:hypothetical protein [Myxococcales bacterium]